jgi:hypothetical protein
MRTGSEQRTRPWWIVCATGRAGRPRSSGRAFDNEGLSPPLDALIGKCVAFNTTDRLADAFGFEVTGAAAGVARSGCP